MASTLRESRTHDQADGSNKVKVTILAFEWGSSKGGLSTINRELAIQLAKCPEVEITFFLPQCSDKDKTVALNHNVKIVEATRRPGFEELEWLSFPPEHLKIDIIVGHGVKLGHQAQFIRDIKNCAWVQVVHTDPEELGMFKNYPSLILKGKVKHITEVELCEMADLVVGVGPKLSKAFRSYMYFHGFQEDQNILDLTPGIFDEFLDVKQFSEDRKHCSVLVFGRGDAKYFGLKGFDIAGKAVAKLPDTHLVVVGAPDGKLEEIAERLTGCGVPANRLRVKGFVQSQESLKRLFQEVDLVLMPARTEGFGLTGLEALSAGLPVLVSQNSGFGEALSNVPFGLFFVIDSEDPNDWAAAIKKIWSKDRKNRLEEAEAVRSAYAMKYNWAGQIKGLLDSMVSMIHGNTSDSTSPQEKTNYSRLCRLLISVGSRVLRDTFDKIIPPQDLQNILKRHPVHSKLHSRRKEGILNSMQWSKLYPATPSEVSSAGFDPALLMVLLRTICNLSPPLAGWDAPPLTADTSLESDIARVKYFLNAVSKHAGEGSVSDAVFSNYWQQIRDTMVRLGRGDLEDVIDEMKYQEMDPLDEEHFQELLKQWKEVENNMKDKLNELESKEASEEEDTSVPPEIRARGPRAELAYQKAIQNGKVEVYRGRIMLLGQARAGKTSLKKSLLGMPFDREEESTIGIDPSKCEVELDEVKNWKSTEGKKPLEAEVFKDIARLMAKDLNEAAVNQKDMHGTDSSSGSEQRPASLEHVDALPSVRESIPDITPESISEIDIRGENVAQSTQSNGPAVQRIQLEIDTTAPKDVTEQLVRYLKGLELEDENKAKEVTLTLWDFAGQHLYYASHSVFLSMRAVYVLVYNLSKTLDAQAEPCARQGIHEIVLDNPNDNTNLDNLLSWLVSVHGIRPTTEEAGRDLDVQEAKLPYLRPPVLIVGTHADQQSPEDIKKMEECIQKSILGTSYERNVIRTFFAVDNTNSRGIQKLQKKIMDVVQQEPYMGEEVPLRWFNFEKVVEALVLKKTFHMNLGQLQTVTREVCHIDDEEELTAMLNFYHDLGVIVKHGQTVVLQAQWLIDLFKQLITVRPFQEMNPLYSWCWHELQERGILQMDLVDHVFDDFIKKGLNKQDILDMMELYGLIAKFSCLSSEGEQKQKYFVPAQLTSSSSGLRKIKPSECDPCPLYLHFLDDFVPHGLFYLLLSRCIGWCSKQGFEAAPQLYHNGARLFIGTQIIFSLILICRKRFIKVILKRRCPISSGSSSIAASTKMAGEVRAFLEGAMHGMSCELSYLRNIRYEVCVACTLCLQSTDQCSKHKAVSCAHDDCLHLLPLCSEEELICTKSLDDETVKVYGLDKWLQVHKAENDERRLEIMTLEDSVTLKCGTPTTDDFLLIAFELGTSWKIFGRALHLKEPVLEQIEEDEARLIERCYGVLIKWSQHSAPMATYQYLAKALEQCGRSDLAAKYCDACSNSLEDYTASTQSLTLKTGTPSPDELLNIANNFCNSWKMLSRALHLHEPVVAQIVEEERKMGNKCYAVLIKWSENFGSEATYQCLAKALQHPAVGHSDLVVKFCTLQYAEK